MTDQIFFDVMLAASSCMMVTGIILAAVKPPSDERRAKCRVAKCALSVAVFVVGLLNLVQIGFDPAGGTRYLGSCLALAVSYVEAMLFTVAVVVLLRPEEVMMRRMLWQVAGIAVVDLGLVGGFFLLPMWAFLRVYGLSVVLYVVQLVGYTLWYRRCRRQFAEQVSAYYGEDEIGRSLRWLGVLFWAAVAVGVLSLLMVVGHRTIDAWLTVVVALFYALLAASFINYQLSASIILPALNQRHEPAEESSESTDVADFAGQPDRLVAWIERGGYLDTQAGVEDIARELEMSLEQLHAYFNTEIGEDFRTWRVRKRVEYAMKLMSDHPDWSVARIARESGFNDRSWFYRQFQRFTGQTVAAYRGQ